MGRGFAAVPLSALCISALCNNTDICGAFWYAYLQQI